MVVVEEFLSVLIEMNGIRLKPTPEGSTEPRQICSNIWQLTLIFDCIYLTCLSSDICLTVFELGKQMTNKYLAIFDC